MIDSTMQSLFKGEEVTLQQMLDSREQRAAYQQALHARFRAPVICLLCNMPGAIKANAAAARIFTAGRQALLGALPTRGFPLLYQEERSLLTGPEGYYCAGAPADALKRLCCGIEEAHPLGRLFDLDVIPPGAVPISRTELGLPIRKCLVCGGAAAICAGRRLHAQPEVLKAIAKLLSEA